MQKITSAIFVRNAPRRGNKHVAQGIALGMGIRNNAPCKGKSIIAEVIFNITNSLTP